jgi:hypothetical protein
MTEERQLSNFLNIADLKLNEEVALIDLQGDISFEGLMHG